jgi:hypothetical protein
LQSRRLRSDHARQRQLALLATATAAALPTRAALAARIALAGYVLILTGKTLESRAGWRTGVVLATIHAVWGTGVVGGVHFAARSIRPRLPIGREPEMGSG